MPLSLSLSLSLTLSFHIFTTHLGIKASQSNPKTRLNNMEEVCSCHHPYNDISLDVYTNTTTKIQKSHNLSCQTLIIFYLFFLSLIYSRKINLMYKRYTQDSLKNYIQRIQANERDSMTRIMEPTTLRPKTVDHSQSNLKKRSSIASPKLPNLQSVIIPLPPQYPHQT